MSIRLGLVAPFVFGPVGFARVARMMALGLDDQGIDVRLVDVRHPKFDRTVETQDFERLREFSQKTWQPDVWLSLSPGCGFVKDKKEWNIGMSMWETPKLPEFGAHCQEVDEVWVPSPWNWEVFSSSPYAQEDKVAYMPLGVDTELHYPHEIEGKITDSFNTEFNYIYAIVCGYSARKGVDLVLTAHHELFTKESKVALLVKGDLYGSRLFPRDIQAIYRGESIASLPYLDANKQADINRKVSEHKPYVLYSWDSLSDKHMADLFCSIDGFVFPSRGEGFGLHPLDAMSTGVPVVGTAATGMRDYMLPDISYPVPSKGWRLCPGCDWITGDYIGHKFADPDYEVYRDSVWEMYSKPEEAKKKALKAREFVVENYSYQVVTKRMKDRLEEALGGHRTTENYWPEK